MLTVALNSYADSKNVIQTSNLPSEKTKSLHDREILTWLITLDSNEIAASKLALSKEVNPDIKNYAQTILAEHMQNLHKTMALNKKMHGDNIKTKAIVALKDKGKKELNILKPLKGKEFEQAYISAMVTGHAEALQAIDQHLSNVGPNSILESHLKETRDHIERQLEAAKTIQKAMG